MEDLYCVKCLDYTHHENVDEKTICQVCGEEYDHSKRRVIICGPVDDPIVIKAKEKFLTENPEAIVISEDVALKHKLGGIPMNPKDLAMKIEPSPMIRQLEDMKYAHLTKKEREANIEPVRTEPKIGRNELCPCGSGKKYKKCCLKK